MDASAFWAVIAFAAGIAAFVFLCATFETRYRKLLYGSLCAACVLLCALAAGLSVGQA